MAKFDRFLRGAWPVGLAAAVSACGTPGLPSRSEASRNTRPAPASVVAPARPARSARLAQASAEQPMPTAGMQAPPGAPLAAAVEARFAEPPAAYRIPAFEPGRSQFTTNAEMRALLRGLVRGGEHSAGRTTVKLLSLGASQGGAPLQALLFTRSGDTEPAALLRSGRPTVLLVGQQRGDEPAGAEALLAVAQELAHGGLEPLLDRLNVVIMPRANPDGARDNRGAAADGVDVVHDHLLLETPEARAQAHLVREFRPVLVVDLREYAVSGLYLQKFGAVQRADALVQYAMTANVPPFVTKAAQEWFREPLAAGLQTEGLSSDWYHTVSDDAADKRVSMGGPQPDSSRNVNGLANAVSFMVASRGAGLGREHLKRRVYTHVAAVSSLLQSAADHSADLVKLRQFVDNDVSAQACQGQVVVGAATTPSEYTLKMLDAATGEDKSVTVAWDSALALHPLGARPRPCGYWLASDQADAVRRLRELGVLVEQVGETTEMRGEAYRERLDADPAEEPGRAEFPDAGPKDPVRIDTVPMLIDADAGSYYVPMNQPLANVAAAALEPDTAGSYFAHGVLGVLAGEARVMAPPQAKLSPPAP